MQNAFAILLDFINFKLPFVVKIFVLCIFEWPIYTGFIVYYTPGKTSFRQQSKVFVE